MLIKCSVCNIEKEETEFNRIKGKCNPCCHILEYERDKGRMNDSENGENYYLRKVILRHAKERSKRKKLEFNLTLAYLISLKNNICPILGCEILYKSGVDNKRSASLDRIDPNKGYVTGNVKIVSFEGNTLKNKNDIRSLLKTIKYMMNSTLPEDRPEEVRRELADLAKDF